MQHGHLLEQIIADFNSQFFMNDFVFLNPKYLREKNEKELCDLLLVLNDEAIVISVKGTDGEPKSESRLLSWLTKKTWKGSNQAKGGITWLSRVPTAARNLWDEEVMFKPGSLRPICGVTVLDCSQKPFGSIEYDMRVPESDIPLHVLSVNDFLNVIKWLGSIADVYKYFSRRASVLSVVTGINQEQPILAYYTLRSNTLEGLSMDDQEELCMMHNLYLIENLENFEERDKYANYVNSIVQALHERHPSIESYMPPELMHRIEPLDKRQSYREMGAMLNALPISIKVHIGRRLEKMIKEVSVAGKAGCFAIKPLAGKSVFVFGCFSKLSRTERVRQLHAMVPAALYQHKVRNGVGVAIDADNSRTGFDLMLIRDQSGFTEADKRIGAYLFPNTEETLVADSFGQARVHQVPKS
jgi:hypothetical protein